MQDSFGLNSAVYTFKNLCVQNPMLQLGDRTTKVILNAKGIAEALEETEDDIRRIYEVVIENAPEYDIKKIMEKLKG